MDAVSKLLLRRRGVVIVDGVASAEPQADEVVREVETRLLELGYVTSAPLRDALTRRPPASVRALGDAVHDELAEALGAHRPHVPLFRGFPESTPHDTEALYVQRLLVYLFQRPEQPCLLCGNEATVHAVSPCAHLVCHACFDGADYSACPICRRRLDADDPFFKPCKPTEECPAPRQPALRILRLGPSPEASAREWFEALVARTTPLNPDDADALGALIGTYGARVLAWVPERIPLKETMAAVYGGLLRLEGAHEGTLAHAAEHLRTATDVLRVACVALGGKADLVRPIQLDLSMRRGLRRDLLATLEALPLDRLLEDVLRHREAWKRVGARLHPFEFHRRLPNTTLAFAIVRATKIDRTTDLGRTLVELQQQHPDLVRARAGRLHAITWAGKVEAALREQRLEEALGLLAQRPGEMMRRLDHLLRITAGEGGTTERLIESLSAMVSRIAAPMLLMVHSHLRRRDRPFPRRVFFPRGDVANVFATSDERPLLSPDHIGSASDILERELLRRAERAGSRAGALLDARLGDLMVPFGERSASRRLVDLPRGSCIPLPSGERVRLFLHWTEPKGTVVDLDLSVAMYDEAWQFKTLCDYTQFRVGEDAAVHSGDLTSAPPPLGASEFVDLNLRKLAAEGIRYLVVAIFSYNDVPFERMNDAFAGLMSSPPTRRSNFDPRRVEQRFDLQGEAKLAVPMLVDLQTKRMRWLDLNSPVKGRRHSVASNRGPLAFLGRDLTDYFGSGARPSMWQLGCVHAAARADYVCVRDERGHIIESYLRRAAETKASFFRRLVAREGREEGSTKLPDLFSPWFVAVLKDDVPAPEGSDVYALRRGHVDVAVNELSAADLIAALGM